MEPIVRLDDNPTHIVFDYQSKRYAAVRRRPFTLFKSLPEGPVEVLVKKSPSIRFYFKSNGEIVEEDPSPHFSDAKMLIADGKNAFPALVVSSNKNICHAAEFNPKQKKYKPVEFRRTKLSEPYWPYTEFTAVITHGVLHYGTEALMTPRAIGFTFGVQHEHGGFVVTPIENGKLGKKIRFY